MCTETCIFKDFGDLCAYRGVEKGNATTNLAAQGMVESVVVCAQ